MLKELVDNVQDIAAYFQEYDIKETVFNNPAAGMDEQGMYITMRFAFPRYIVRSNHL